jgi:hypothetical protein
MSSPFKQRFASKSPLKQGAYESAADNDVYLSTQPQMQQVQNALTKIGVAAAKASNDPGKKAERQAARVENRKFRTAKRDTKLVANDALADGHEDKWSPSKRDNFEGRTGRMNKRTDKVSAKSDVNSKLQADLDKKELARYKRKNKKDKYDSGYFADELKGRQT